jgi:hypothetical protein
MDGGESMSVEFDPLLIEEVAKQLCNYDYGHSRDVWKSASDETKDLYRSFAKVALQATYAYAKVEEGFFACGVVAIEDHPDRLFESDSCSTLVAAERIREAWSQRYGSEGMFTVQHRVSLLLETYRYWDQAELDEIEERAGERAEELAKYVD